MMPFRFSCQLGENGDEKLYFKWSGKYKTVVDQVGSQLGKGKGRGREGRGGEGNSFVFGLQCS